VPVVLQTGGTSPLARSFENLEFFSFTAAAAAVTTKHAVPQSQKKCSANEPFWLPVRPANSDAKSALPTFK
jgi:hypothetical protein